jgi:hypothetical protein
MLALALALPQGVGVKETLALAEGVKEAVPLPLRLMRLLGVSEALGLCVAV